MTDKLREAAQAVVDYWGAVDGDGVAPAMGTVLAPLRKALQDDTSVNDHVPEFAREGHVDEEDSSEWWWEDSNSHVLPVALLTYIRNLEKHGVALEKRVEKLESAPATYIDRAGIKRHVISHSPYEGDE